MWRTVYQTFIRPLLGRPPHFQAAALCYRSGASAEPEILIITSLETRRWILPKGWPKAGYDAGGVALEEAWEEAGIKPAGGPPRHVGDYIYDKRLSGGAPMRTRVKVFAIEVPHLLEHYPEEGMRERRWVSLEEAAEAVDEASLKELLRTLPADTFRSAAPGRAAGNQDPDA